MKVYGVKNDHISPRFKPAISLTYDSKTTILRIDAVITASVGDIEGVAPGEILPATFNASTEVKLNDLRNRADWCEHQTYFLAMENVTFTFDPVFPLFVETLQSREAASEYAKRVQRNLLVGINVPFVDSTDEDIFITVNLNMDATESDFICKGNLERIWSEYSSSGNERTMKFPSIVASANPSVVAEQSTTIDVRLEDARGNLIERDATIYIEAVHGIVSGTRLKVKNGIATLPVSSVGLTAGDDVRVKFGWKYFPGAEDVTIKVV